ncbi:hypothetical protein ABBQ38_000160 [Trebouxia sp. C0009 RCD-2024]
MLHSTGQLQTNPYCQQLSAASRARRLSPAVRSLTVLARSGKKRPKQPYFQLKRHTSLVQTVTLGSRVLGLGFLAKACLTPLVEKYSGSGGGRPPGSGGGGGSGGNGGNHGGSASNALVGDRQDEKKKLAPVTITLVSFAVSRKAYTKLTAQFAKEYEEKTGQAVKFRLSFGGSGTQARAVVDGLPGDMVALALPLDVHKICDTGLIDKEWQERAPNKSVVCESHVAIVTRKGNPKNIKGWDDLTRPDVAVITANPKTAGVARWNFLALWGHKQSQGDDASLDYCKKVFENVPIQPRDAREASDVFYKQHQADVSLNYENEVILTNEMYGEDALPYVVPDNNVLIEFPVAIVDKNINRKKPETRAAAEAFLQYLFTPTAQQEFMDCGFRPVDKALRRKCKLPQVRNVWTVDGKLGGWAATQKRFFDEKGVLDKIQRHVGEKRLAERKAAKKR